MANPYVHSFTETAVYAVALSEMPVEEKRNCIYTLNHIELEYGDRFANHHNIDELVACGYTFRLDKEELPDYPERKPYYDALSPHGLVEDGMYRCEGDSRICVDTGSAVWRQLVEAGRITGAAAEPVTMLPYTEVFRTVRPLLDITENISGDILESLAVAAIQCGAADNFGDAEFAAILGVEPEMLERIISGEESFPVLGQTGKDSSGDPVA